MGIIEAKPLKARKSVSTDEIRNFHFWCLHQSTRLNDQHDVCRALLMASSLPTTLSSSTPPSQFFRLLPVHCNKIFKQIDDLLSNADPTQAGLEKEHQIRGYDTSSYHPHLANLANSCTFFYGTGEQNNVLVAASCNERMELVGRYLGLHQLLRVLNNATTHMWKCRDRENYYAERLSKKSNRKLMTSEELEHMKECNEKSRENILCFAELFDKCRDIYECLYRDYQLNKILHSLNETVRLMRGIRDQLSNAEYYYAYPRSLGLGALNNSDNNHVAAAIVPPVTVPKLSGHSQSLSMDYSQIQNVNPAGNSDNSIPASRRSYSVLSSPLLSDLSQEFGNPLEYLKGLADKIEVQQYRVDLACQHNEFIAFAVASRMLDSFEIQITEESFRTTPVSSRLHAIMERWMHDEAIITGSDIRGMVVNMLNVLDRISTAIQVLLDEHEILVKSIGTGMRVVENNNKRNLLISQAQVEKHALRDLFNFFLKSVLEHSYSTLNDLIQLQTPNVNSLYSDLESVFDAYGTMYPPAAVTTIPPTLVKINETRSRAPDSNVFLAQDHESPFNAKDPSAVNNMKHLSGIEMNGALETSIQVNSISVDSTSVDSTAIKIDEKPDANESTEKEESFDSSKESLRHIRQKSKSHNDIVTDFREPNTSRSALESSSLHERAQYALKTIAVAFERQKRLNVSNRSDTEHSPAQNSSNSQLRESGVKALSTPSSPVQSAHHRLTVNPNMQAVTAPASASSSPVASSQTSISADPPNEINSSQSQSDGIISAEDEPRASTPPTKRVESLPPPTTHRQMPIPPPRPPSLPPGALQLLLARHHEAQANQNNQSASLHDRGSSDDLQTFEEFLAESLLNSTVAIPTMEKAISEPAHSPSSSHSISYQPLASPIGSSTSPALLEPVQVTGEIEDVQEREVEGEVDEEERDNDAPNGRVWPPPPPSEPPKLASSYD